ncbi:MAG: histidine ammonia-lyase [Clostridiales bacterium]|jgi:histidine ammonia-lyase|nr:histidine ammonia-lyase [Clostridiales bacterium]
MMETVIIDGNHLTLDALAEVARKNVPIALSEAAKESVNRARDFVERLIAEKKVVYGITTGFGKFSDVVISEEETEDLQTNLIMSHACGIGDPFAEEIVRAVMLLRINNLAKGHSGIRLSTLQTLIDMLNKGVHPVIPEKGSLGASGDLAPLSHMVLVMLGKGEAFYKGERMSGSQAMEAAGIHVITLHAKEGLALINGTQVMTAVGALTAYDAHRVMRLSDVAGALTSEALNGIVDAFDARMHVLRPHAGQMTTAENLLRLLENSERTTRQGEIRVQDAYTLRCMPQVHGASKDALKYVIDHLDIEMNAVTDNPILFPDTGEAYSGGNFHGQPMALAFDFLGIALSEVANISERRIERLVNPQLSGLPAFLTKHGGLHSGFMIAQYAAAALVSENKVLAHPASVDSIPSSANQEDHVSMGTIAARKAREILFNVEHVLAIELLCAAQAVEFSEKGSLGKGTGAAFAKVRRYVKPVDLDRVMHLDFEKIYDIIKSNEILEAVEAAVGPLKVW